VQCTSPSFVHAFYRGDVRQNAQRIKTNTFRNAARDALAPMLEGNCAGRQADTGHKTRTALREWMIPVPRY
jgi:hypothetical protein